MELQFLILFIVRLQIDKRSLDQALGTIMNKEYKIKHLEMIEAIIERMAKNSFQLKGWAMTLVAAVGALAANGSDQRFVILSFFPVVGFRFIDAYYLYQEHKYKDLYQNIVDKPEEDIDFCMKTEQYSPPVVFGKYLKSLCYLTELLFYGIITVALIILIHVLNIF